MLGINIVITNFKCSLKLDEYKLLTDGGVDDPKVNGVKSSFIIRSTYELNIHMSCSFYSNRST